jgi:5-methylcytosine-specific restriction endonuclease McrA
MDMGFSKETAERALIASRRSCCICHKFCGSKIELHHISQKADGGDDSFENCIPLCFDCHADVGSYNAQHPKGRKYSKAELHVQ